MNQKRRKLLFIVMFILIGVASATGLALKAFKENLLYFYSPTQVRNSEAPLNRGFRIGGLVLEGSVVRNPDNLDIEFTLTDTMSNVVVHYDEILPDLFREGQGIVANGTINNEGIFIASEVLAKHDENYMPPEVAEALKKANVKHSSNQSRQLE